MAANATVFVVVDLYYVSINRINPMQKYYKRLRDTTRYYRYRWKYL